MSAGRDGGRFHPGFQRGDGGGLQQQQQQRQGCDEGRGQYNNHHNHWQQGSHESNHRPGYFDDREYGFPRGGASERAYPNHRQDRSSEGGSWRDRQDTPGGKKDTRGGGQYQSQPNQKYGDGQSHGGHVRLGAVMDASTAHRSRSAPPARHQRAYDPDREYEYGNPGRKQSTEYERYLGDQDRQYDAQRERRYAGDQRQSDYGAKRRGNVAHWDYSQVQKKQRW